LPACLHYHFIFSTKNRANVIAPVLQQGLYDYMGGVPKNLKGRLLAAGGKRDHVHLLASLRPQPAVSDILRDVKSNSSKWVHETFPDFRSFAWQDGFGVFTVSYSGIEEVREYIRNQERHHQSMTFQQEFLLFLERQGIEYDPEYLWG
jgi:REP element-mobilizing transposase RayT